MLFNWWPPVLDPSTIEFLHNIRDLLKACYPLWALAAGILVALSCILSFHLIFRHLAAPGPAWARTVTVRILIRVPFYSLESIVSLACRLNKAENDIILLTQKGFECIVIFGFTKLIVGLLGGVDRFTGLYPWKSASTWRRCAGS